MFNATPRKLYPLHIAGSNYIGGWVGPRASQDGCRNSRLPFLTEILSPDHLVRSENLYRLSYPGPHFHTFLISKFRRVLNVVCFPLGNSPAFEFYMPTFRNTLSVPSS
jgi:hypothetical protein